MSNFGSIVTEHKKGSITRDKDRSRKSTIMIPSTKSSELKTTRKRMEVVGNKDYQVWGIPAEEMNYVRDFQSSEIRLVQELMTVYTNGV